MVGISTDADHPGLKWDKSTKKWEIALKPEKKYLSHETIDFYHRYKDKVKYWLTFNEINNLFKMPFAAGGLLDIDPEDTNEPIKGLTLKEKYQACHYTFVANALAVKACHEIDPEAKIGCMLSMSSCATYPATCNPDDVMGALQFRRKNLFFGDVMCKGEYPGYVKRIWRENDCAPVIDDGDLELIKNILWT